MLKHSLEHTEPWLCDAWIILQGQGQCSSPGLRACCAALSAPLHNSSQVHTVPWPLPGAPHLQENGIRAQNMEGRHRKHHSGPQSPHPGKKDLQEKLCSQSELGFVCKGLSREQNC